MRMMVTEDIVVGFPDNYVVSVKVEVASPAYPLKQRRNEETKANARCTELCEQATAKVRQALQEMRYTA